MKKKILGSAIIFALVALVSLNLKLTKSEKNDFSLSLVKMEALAQDNEMNPWYQWISQGLTKDEAPVSILCPGKTVTVKVCVKVSQYGGCVEYREETRPAPDSYQIRCTSGFVNCSSVSC